MDDSEQIRNVIQLYIDSMNESNPDKVKQVFHSNAKVVWLGIFMGILWKCQ